MHTLIILALYAIIVLSYILLVFFIIYHLANYSIKSSLNSTMLLFCILISGALLVMNVAFFFAVKWNVLLAKFLL